METQWTTGGGGTSAADGLDLPTLYAPVRLRPDQDPFGEACRRAAAEGLDAGTLLWAPRRDVASFAVVLEPEEPLVGARRAVFVGLNALADALSVALPPEKEVTFEWPTTIFVDGARIGGMRLGWPKTAGETEVPGWLVLSAVVWLDASRMGEPGTHPNSTCLAEEGVEAPSAAALVESFARHLMAWFDRYAEKGMKPIADGYLSRLPRGEARVRRGIDGNGDLLVHGAEPGAATRAALLPDLKAPAWLDRATGAPRL